MTRAEGCNKKEAPTGKPSRKRPIRRPRRKWMDAVDSRGLIRIDPTYRISLTLDENLWRGIVETAKDLNGLF